MYSFDNFQFKEDINMSLASWMQEFDDATDAWKKLLQVSYQNYAEYRRQLAQPPLSSFFNEENDYQHHINELEKMKANCNDAYTIRNLDDNITTWKQKIFTLRVLVDTFGADKIRHTQLEERQLNFGLLDIEGNFRISFAFNCWYNEGTPGAFVECFSDQHRFSKISDFIKFITPYIHEIQYPRKLDNVLDKAIREGDLTTVIQKHNEGALFNPSAMNRASAYNHLDIVKWLHENRSEGGTIDSMNWAAKNGHINTLQWLHDNRTEGCSYKAIDYAAQFNHFDIVQWLSYNTTEGCSRSAFQYAVKNGNLELVKFLNERHRECYKFISNYDDSDMFRNLSETAVKENQLDILKYLILQGYGAPSYLLRKAVKSGHLQIIHFFVMTYKHLIPQVDRETYEKLIPFIQEQFAETFKKIQKENIVRDFISKRLLYHPTSSYMKRVVESF